MNTWIVIAYLFLSGKNVAAMVHASPEYHTHDECFVQGIGPAEEGLRKLHPEVFTDPFSVKFDCVQKPYATSLESKKPAQGGLL